MFLNKIVDSLDESIVSTIEELKRAKGEEKATLAKTLKAMVEARAALIIPERQRFW